jgi:hypothetical protein
MWIRYGCCAIRAVQNGEECRDASYGMEPGIPDTAPSAYHNEYNIDVFSYSTLVLQLMPFQEQAFM